MQLAVLKRGTRLGCLEGLGLGEALLRWAPANFHFFKVRASRLFLLPDLLRLLLRFLVLFDFCGHFYLHILERLVKYVLLLLLLFLVLIHNVQLVEGFIATLNGLVGGAYEFSRLGFLDSQFLFRQCLHLIVLILFNTGK